MLLSSFVSFSVSSSGLKLEASNALAHIIDARNVAAVLSAADALGAPRLKAACLAYIARNIDVLVCGCALAKFRTQDKLMESSDCLVMVCLAKSRFATESPKRRPPRAMRLFILIFGRKYVPVLPMVPQQEQQQQLHLVRVHGDDV